MALTENNIWHSSPMEGQRMARIKTIKRFETVVNTLGGPKKMTGRLGFGKHQQGQSVHIWRKDQKFPAKHYLMIQYLLLTKDCIAATTLFSFNDEGLPPAFKRMYID